VDKLKLNTSSSGVTANYAYTRNYHLKFIDQNRYIIHGCSCKCYYFDCSCGLTASMTNVWPLRLGGVSVVWCPWFASISKPSVLYSVPVPILIDGSKPIAVSHFRGHSSRMRLWTWSWMWMWTWIWTRTWTRRAIKPRVWQSTSHSLRPDCVSPSVKCSL